MKPISGIMLLAAICVELVILPTTTLAQQQAQQQSSSVPPFMQGVTASPTGPIDETMVTCNMEDLEQANDSQLYTILHDLKQTAFFRTFRVDLSQTCPLRSWRTMTGGHSSSHHDNDDDDDGDKQFDFSTKETEEAAEEEEDEFACPGAQLDVDEDAEPLCTVLPEDDDEAGEDDGLGFLGSSALHSLSKDGFQSYDQEKTYTWNKHVDRVVTPTAATAANKEDKNCDQDKVHLPQDFWVDLCTRVSNDDPSVVNLHLNPERNTGYNGTHIWKAIYEENCRAVSPNSENGSDDSGGECLEERVLYRLLSGLHASTTLSIAKNYYPPSKRKGRVDWESNPTFFYDKFHGHSDHVRNLHFSYVVLLRALTKASEFLYQYEIRTGDVVQDEMATVLLRRLLDSSILQSCTNVFSAFDESLLFSSVSSAGDFSLQHSFKDVFFNVSSILDCVQCQQCKLHGKMSMLGYGTALKILFSPSATSITDFGRLLSRNEIVALINTLAKFSESIRHVRELTQSYLLTETTTTTTAASQQPQQLSDAENAPTTLPSSMPVASTFDAPENGAILSVPAVDAAVGAIASLARQGLITEKREAELIQLALARHAELLILARHYASVDPQKFLQLSQYLTTTTTDDDDRPDAIVIGSGLAGMAATLNILDRGGKVILVEKEHLLGGNSNKASSGINACCPGPDNNGIDERVDTVDLFRNDTTRSAGSSARPDLIDVLVGNSGDAVTWLRNRAGVDLSLKAQLGGHAAKRTHRPSNGMAGAEIIYGVQKAIKAYLPSGRITILTDTKVTKLVEHDGRVVGVEHVSTLKDDTTTTSESKKLYADNVILATGGFAADRSEGSYLSQYRPELLKMPATAGDFSTGDGISLATAFGAGRVDMDKVQLHPTGWVDPAEPGKTTKILAAELMRGVGGILINHQGERFCNELGTRAYVTDQMLSHNSDYVQNNKQWNVEAPIPTFSLVLSSSAALDGKKHVDLYTHKGLLTKLEGVAALAEWMKQPKSKVVETLRQYQAAAKTGVDEFGKTSFRGVPEEDLESEVFYAGTVTPVLHYCMGGITIDTQGNVLTEAGDVIPGLHAAGEVTGGVHGVNRLGGNSLLECTVYGTIVGQKIPIRSKTGVNPLSNDAARSDASSSSTTQTSAELRAVSVSELAQHNTPEDCWVAIDGFVYDLTSFAEEHPAGPASIHYLAGKDGSEAFAAVHNAGILEEVEEDIIGKLLDAEEQEQQETGDHPPQATTMETPTDDTRREATAAGRQIQQEAVETPTSSQQQQDAAAAADKPPNAGQQEARPSGTPSFYFWKSP